MICSVQDAAEGARPCSSTRAAIAIGSVTSTDLLTLVPWNPSAVTPTITNGDRLMSIVFPTMPGSPPKRRCQ
jgi:hypothetical protein